MIKIVGHINAEIFINTNEFCYSSINPNNKPLKKPIYHKEKINGRIVQMEYTINPLINKRNITLEIVEDLGVPTEKIMARCKPIPYQNEFENEKQKLKEKDTMTVKIKKQPKIITLEELKQADEFEKVIIHIDNEKKEEIEEKYGVKYGISNKTWFTNEELEFKEHYLRSSDDYTIPYEIITKIEVVKK